MKNLIRPQVVFSAFLCDKETPTQFIICVPTDSARHICTIQYYLYLQYATVTLQ